MSRNVINSTPLNIFLTFLGNFVAGGTLVGIAAVATKYVGGGLGGFLYGVIPMGILYLYIYVNITFGYVKKELMALTEESIYGGLLWILYIFILLYLTKYTKLNEYENGFIYVLLASLAIYIGIVSVAYIFGNESQFVKFFISLILLLLFINMYTFNISTYFLDGNSCNTYENSIDCSNKTYCLWDRIKKKCKKQLI